MEKQHSAGRGRLTGGVTPQGDIVLNRDNRHTDPKTSLKTGRKKAIQNIREIGYPISLFSNFTSSGSIPRI